MNGDLPSAETPSDPTDDLSRSVTQIPLVPREDRAEIEEPARIAPLAVADVAAAVPPPVPASQTDSLSVADPAAQIDPIAAAVAAGTLSQTPQLPPNLPPGQPGLLYYAVYLPAPSGVPGGLPLYLPAAAGGGAFPPAPPPSFPPANPMGVFAPPAPPFAVSEAQAHNQKLLITGIITAVFVVHLPWLVYLFAVHACWGTFLESCYSVSAMSAEDLADPFAEAVGTPMLFARVVFLMLRVQAVLAGDWGQFSQAMQVSTGAGSFILTRIVAANGLVAEGRFRIWLLAASCAFAFGLLFWAELHLLGDQAYPELGAQTVLAYIDQNLPVDFLAYSNVEASLQGYLQFLRLADALILGAALAVPTTRKSA